MPLSTARRGYALPALALAMAIGAPQASALADDVLDALDAAREHYDAGELSRTLRELQYATEGVSAELTRAYAETLPDAPDGWEAGEADAAPGQAQGMAALGMGGGQSVSRGYQELNGDGSLEASLMVDNPMMQMMTGMLSNPAMAQASGYNRVRVGRDDAMLKFEGDQGEALMIVDGRILLRIEGRGLDDDDVLREMMTSWNIDDVRRVASN